MITNGKYACRIGYSPISYACLLAFLALLVTAPAGCRTTSDAGNSTQQIEPAGERHIPDSLVAEHLNLQRQLKEAMNSGGQTGTAARAVADQLEPHFLKEEEYALPPLALLAPISQGKQVDNPQLMIARSERLRSELTQMLTEHKAIAFALDRLETVARNENKPTVVEFCEHLRLHAQNEEEILYPAAILVGDYLKLRSRP